MRSISDRQRARHVEPFGSRQRRSRGGSGTFRCRSPRELGVLRPPERPGSEQTGPFGNGGAPNGCVRALRIGGTCGRGVWAFARRRVEPPRLDYSGPCVKHASHAMRGGENTVRDRDRSLESGSTTIQSSSMRRCMRARSAITPSNQAFAATQAIAGSSPSWFAISAPRSMR
jgi:hypothetical protein